MLLVVIFLDQVQKKNMPELLFFRSQQQKQDAEDRYQKGKNTIVDEDWHFHFGSSPIGIGRNDRYKIGVLAFATFSRTIRLGR